MTTRRWVERIGSAVAVSIALATLAPAVIADGPEVEVKEFKVLARNWSFTPDRVQVEQGTKVILQIESHDAPHSFVMKAYRLKVPLPQDKTTEVAFVADKVGTFRWHCGRPCGNGCPKMTGELTVVPRLPEPTPEDAQRPDGS